MRVIPLTQRPSDRADVALMRLVCDWVSARPECPVRVLDALRERAGSSDALALYQATHRLGALPWHHARPEGPLNLRAWARVADEAREAAAAARRRRREGTDGTGGVAHRELADLRPGAALA